LYGFVLEMTETSLYGIQTSNTLDQSWNRYLGE
jgi:hypothetical protein